MFSICWYIKYPETINFPLIINKTSVNINKDADKRDNFSDNEFKYICEGSMRERNYMEINIGQQVNIKLTAYNFNDYGILIGRVVEKKLDPESNRFKVLIDLERGLFTSFKKKIEYYSGMSGIAEIIIRDQRLLERFFSRSRILLRK